MVELLPFNWEWKGVSRIYKNITASMGDIHHFAWRAKHPKWAVYPSEHEARYAEWTAEECASRSSLITASAGLLRKCTPECPSKKHQGCTSYIRSKASGT